MFDGQAFVGDAIQRQPYSSWQRRQDDCPVRKSIHQHAYGIQLPRRYHGDPPAHDLVHEPQSSKVTYILY